MNLNSMKSNCTTGIGSTPPVEPALSKAFNVLHLLLSGMPINIAGAHARTRVNQILRGGFGGRRLRILLSWMVKCRGCYARASLELFRFYIIYSHLASGKNQCRSPQPLHQITESFVWLEARMPSVPPITRNHTIEAMLHL
jgi:hypothetical protein